MWRWIRTVFLYILLLLNGRGKHDRFVQSIIRQYKKKQNRRKVNGITEELDEVLELPDNCFGDTHFVGFARDGQLASFRTTVEGNTQEHTNVSLEFPGIGTFTYNDSRALSFGTGKLRLEMLDPMRRWKIAFNGSIDSHVGGGDIERLHASVSLYWQCLADPFDHYTSVSRWQLAKNHFDQLWDKTPWKDLFDNEHVWYEQWGEMRGKLEIEGHESQLVRMKGFRSRQMAVSRDALLVSHHVIEDGGGYSITNGCVYDQDRGVKERFGYLTTPLGERWPTEKADLRLQNKNCSCTLNCKKIQYPTDLHFSGISLTIDKIKERQNLINKQKGPVITSITFCTYTINGESASGIGCRSSVSHFEPLKKGQQLKLETLEKTKQLTLPFNHEHCRIPSLAGGKCANIATLQGLNYSVPNGFCVTTHAFQIQLEALAILQTSRQMIANVIRNKVFADLPRVCAEAVRKFTDTGLCNSIAVAIEGELKRTFGPKYDDIHFAVRSSGVSEDGGEASYAGQMETILEVKGLENILQAVRKCWASSVCYEVVEYRRQNGQPATEPIAVIIQEMVDADTAGVLFTNDPVTGSSSVMVINAAPGLGDKIVAGKVTPDAVNVSRNKGHEQLEVTMKYVGTKSKEDGTVVNEATEDYNCEQGLCITDAQILDLCRLGLQAEDNFGNPQDIEWAMSKGHIYILQSRPITVLVKETDEELMHEFDSPMAMDCECVTRYNLGEVMPSAATTLTIDWVSQAWLLVNCTLTSLLTGLKVPWYADKSVLCFNNTVFLNMTSQLALSDACWQDKDAAAIAYTGRVLDEITSDVIHKYRGERRSVLNVTLRLIAFQLIYLLKHVKSFADWKKNLDTFTIGGKAKSAADLYYCIEQSKDKYFNVLMHYAFILLQNEITYDMLCKMLRGKNKRISHTNNEDIAVLLSKCSNIISANVPRAMQKLAAAIQKSSFKSQFLQLSDIECHKFLINEVGSIGTRYTDFVKENGHRCLKEYEFYEIPWGSNPAPLMRALKLLVKSPLTTLTSEEATDEFNVDQLKTAMSWVKKFIIKTILLGKVKSGVADREIGKSVAIKTISVFKTAYWRLADLMVREGRLPEDKLLFFLTHREIGSLIETRSAALVRKAKDRMKVFRKQNDIEYKLINFGLPEPLMENEEQVQMDSTTTVCRGTPVGKGIASGTARVITSLDDADQIQPGDILICRYTDIAWSPYFPMLSGIVTEIGGIVSHGAVIAREVGIPCVVCVPNATRIFRSGETVKIDGLGGTLTKLADC